MTHLSHHHLLVWVFVYACVHVCKCVDVRVCMVVWIPDPNLERVWGITNSNAQDTYGQGYFQEPSYPVRVWDPDYNSDIYSLALTALLNSVASPQHYNNKSAKWTLVLQSQLHHHRWEAESRNWETRLQIQSSATAIVLLCACHQGQIPWEG